MENGTKLMIYKNRRVYINFRNGIPHIPVIDSWDGEELEFQIDPKFLGNIEDYPYLIEVEVFSYEHMARRTYNFFYKTESEAKDALSKYAIGNDFFDDEIIKNLAGPLKVATNI